MSSLADENVGHVANLSYKLASTASRLALLATLLLALLLRVYRLDVQSLWYDEAVTAHVAAQGIAELTRWTADDIQPPLYYYVVAGWTRVAGNREWALRFPSVFCSTLTVVLIWGLARRLYGGRSGRVAGLAAALLAALSPLYVYYAQEARMYAQLTFLGMLAGYALLRAVGGEGARATQGRGAAGWRRPAIWWATFVLASVAALYTHYFAAFLLLAFGICVGAAFLPGLLRPESRGRAANHLIAFVAAGGAIVVLYLPWLPAMLTRYRVDRSYWQGALKLGEALRHVAVSFTAGAPETMLEADAVRLLPWFGAVLGVAAAALVLARWGRFAGVEEPLRGSEGAGSGGAASREQRGFDPLSTCLSVCSYRSSSSLRSPPARPSSMRAT